MAEPIDIADALEILAAKRPHYERYHRYYHGDPDTHFASDAYRATFAKLLKRLRYNRCQSVVDAIADRLQIESWQLEGDQDNETGGQPAQDEWARARGDMVQGLVHVEALRSGDAYLIVWPSPDDEATPLWRVQRADSCFVVADDETAAPVMAIKCWRVERGPLAGYWRLTIYDEQVITRWVTSKKSDRQPVKAASFVPYEDDDGYEGRNPYGIVPVFHFPNNPQFQGECGISELEDVIPLQDGLNYSVWQQMIGAEYVSLPQRWATGVEPMIDPFTGQTVDAFTPGVDRLWQVANEASAFGQFPDANLSQFIELQDSWDQKISRVSRVPVHWLGMQGDFPSGEALKTAESPFVAKLRDRQLAFGDAWERAMRLALTITGVAETSAAVTPVWASPEPRSELEGLQNAQLQQNVGIPQEQIWRELGYTEDQISEFARMNEEAAQRKAEQFAVQFGQGNADGFGANAP